MECVDGLIVVFLEQYVVCLVQELSVFGFCDVLIGLDCIWEGVVIWNIGEYVIVDFVYNVFKYVCKGYV